MIRRNKRLRKGDRVRVTLGVPNCPLATLVDDNVGSYLVRIVYDGDASKREWYMDRKHLELVK